MDCGGADCEGCGVSQRCKVERDCAGALACARAADKADAKYGKCAPPPTPAPVTSAPSDEKNTDDEGGESEEETGEEGEWVREDDDAVGYCAVPKRRGAFSFARSVERGCS